MVANRKAWPGLEVAGFCTTSSLAYAGLVRSSSEAGSARPFLANQPLSMLSVT